jgi:hypothetical protein
LFILRVYEKLNEPLNVAIAYTQFTEDQKLMKRANGCVKKDDYTDLLEIQIVIFYSYLCSKQTSSVKHTNIWQTFI